MGTTAEVALANFRRSGSVPAAEMESHIVAIAERWLESYERGV